MVREKMPFMHKSGTDITLAPGELYFGKAPAIVHTLLGSCVAITFWHSKYKVGGMCHYLLAHRESYLKNEHHPEGYYGSDAVAYFAKQLQKYGFSCEEVEVKLFGGGNMFNAIHEGGNPLNVASNNITQGYQLLMKYGFNIKTEDVGGVRYRKIYFDLSNGDVWVQYGKHAKT